MSLSSVYKALLNTAMKSKRGSEIIDAINQNTARVIEESFMFEQTTPSDTWTINHGLGYKPNTELFTIGGVEFEAQVVHTSVNQCIVNLNSPLAGSARLS